MKPAILLALFVTGIAAGQALPIPLSGNVTLSLEEYTRLMELAAKPAAPPDGPPSPYSLKHAEIKLNVTAEFARGSVEFTGEVFGRGILKVPLLAGMTVFEGQQRGQSLALQQEGGTHTAVLTGPAEFFITLDAGLPLTIEAGRASIHLPVPASGTVRLALSVPGDNTHVNISPGVITSRESNGGRTQIEATLVPGQPASLWWATRESAAQAAPRPARFLSDVKTLVSVREAALVLTALIDVTVVQGEPAQFEVNLPAGYELTAASGATLESSDQQAGVLTLKVNASAKSHQFLLSLEKPLDGSKSDVPFLSWKGAQRETGETLVEGVGAMELTGKEGGALKRMDLREVNAYLRSLAREPLQAAFRYHAQPGAKPELTLEWNRFPDRSILSAVARQAVVTTMVTSEGKSLTEVRLFLSNQSKPFLKVALPAGASIVSADVAGERVKPLEGPDGHRVPLLRAGFRPTAVYQVSFVFLHSGTPFEKKGGSGLALPKVDVPISLLEWEVFLPSRYKVSDFGGDAIPSHLLVRDENVGDEEGSLSVDAVTFGTVAARIVAPNEIRAITEATAQTITVEAAKDAKADGRQNQLQQTAASANVTNLQRRMAGVLPIKVDVPRAGASFHFARPLVIEEETRVTFRYKTK